MLQVKWWKWRGQAFRPIFLNSCSSAMHGTNSTRQRGGRWLRGRESRRRLSRFLRLTSAGGQRSSQSCFLTCTWWITSVWCWKGIYIHGIPIWCTDWIYFLQIIFPYNVLGEVPVLLYQIEAELEDKGGQDQCVDSVVWGMINNILMLNWTGCYF